MIVARTSNGRWIIGIDAENVRRLKAGQPMRLNLRKHGGKDELLLVYGETLDDIKAELEEVTGQALPLPKPMPSGNGNVR